MAHVVNAWRRSTRRHIETEIGQQSSKHPTDTLTSQPTARTNGEERLVIRKGRGARAPQGEVTIEHPAYARPERDEAVLGKLRVANDEEVSRPIDVAYIEAASL